MAPLLMPKPIEAKHRMLHRQRVDVGGHSNAPPRIDVAAKKGRGDAFSRCLMADREARSTLRHPSRRLSAFADSRGSDEAGLSVFLNDLSPRAEAGMMKRMRPRRESWAR